MVRVPPGRAGGQVDHIVGRAALRVVDTVVLDGDANGPRLEIMAAAALFGPAVRHRHLAIDAGIDAVRAAQPAVAAAEARKGRTDDGPRRVAVVGGQYAFLRAPGPAVAAQRAAPPHAA